MRYLLIFMLVVGVFILGPRFSNVFKFNVSVHGSGPVQTETRALSGFHAVDLSIPADVLISIDTTFDVKVEAQENLLSYIKTEVQNGILRIYVEGNIRSEEPMRITITMPDLDGVEVTGSGEVHLKTPLRTDKLNIDISGSGDVYMQDLQVQELSGEITGSGKIDLGGMAENMKVEINGSGDFLAENLNTKSTNTTITGSGTVRCQVQERLNAELNGSGSVYYKGNPVIQSDITGSGSIKIIQ